MLKPRTMDDLLAEGYVEPEWAIQDWLIAGESALIIGEPKAFKSTLAIDMAVALAAGTPFLGQYDVPVAKSVLFIQEENNATIVMPQLYALMERSALGRMEAHAFEDDEGGTHIERTFHVFPEGEDLPFLMSVRAGWQATADGGQMDEVIDLIKEYEIDYVFIDPLYKVIAGGMTHPDDIAPTLRNLSRIENETDAVVVLIHHANKSSSKGGSRILGSQLIWAWGANNIYMEKKGQGGASYIQVEREFRAAQEPNPVKLVFQPDFLWEIGEVQFDSSGKVLDGRKSHAKDDYLAKKDTDVFKGMTQKDIANLYGVTTRTLREWNKE